MEETAMVPRQQSKTGLYVALVAAVLAVIGALAFFAMPKNATLAVNVADTAGKEVAKLEVVVDDQKRCDSAPCIVRDLPPGVHSVKVKADGYEALAPRAVTIASGKDDTLSFALAKAGGDHKVSLTSTQPGLRVTVDGKDPALPLPADLKDLAQGPHTLKIEGGDRYESMEKTITVASADIAESFELKVKKGKVTFEPGTPGAKAHLESGANKRALPYLPIAIDFDPKESWTLVASAPGYDDLKMPISFASGPAEKTIKVELPAKGSAIQNVALTPAAAQPAAQPAVVKQPVAAQPAVPAQPKPAPAAAAGEAFLNINSLPASTVVLDGKPLGATPKLKVAVSAGSHTVMFVNAEQSLKKSITVTVGAGETKPAFAKLRD